MFTSTIIIEFVVGTICLVAAALLIHNGKSARKVDAVVAAAGERPGAYFVEFERDGKHFRANYRSKQELPQGAVVPLTITEKHIIPANWKFGVGLCIAMAVFDYVMAIMGLVA